MDIPPSLNVFLHVFAGVFGVCVGSFLNVCIYRLPKEDMSIWKPKRSLCFSCRETIGWYDNIPVISYLILRGRCRHCGEKFSPRYAMVEFLTGVFFVLIYHRFGLSLAMPIYLALGAALIAASFIDIDHFIIPDEITLPGIGIGLAVGVFVPLIFWKQETGFIPASVADSLIGGFLGAGFLWSMGVFGKAVFGRDAMGFGDVKLLGMIGLFVGWKMVIATIVFSAFVGVLIGVPTQLIQKKGRYAHIPYGPYLAGAALVCILWGERLLPAYFDIMGQLGDAIRSCF